MVLSASGIRTCLINRESAYRAHSSFLVLDHDIGMTSVTDWEPINQEDGQDRGL
jgi:hypothetical protein